MFPVWTVPLGKPIAAEGQLLCQEKEWWHWTVFAVVTKDCWRRKKRHDGTIAIWGKKTTPLTKQSWCGVVATSCLTVSPWTAARQALLSMGFSRQDYWSGFLFPSPEALPNPRIEPTSPVSAGRFFIAEPPGKPHRTVLPPSQIKSDQDSRSNYQFTGGTY